MSVATVNPQCYVKMRISVCDHVFYDTGAYFFSSFQTVNDVLQKAKSLDTEKKLPWAQSSSKIYAYDDLTNEPLEGKQLLIRYYPEGGCATVRVHIDDYLTRGVLSMD